MTAPSFMDLALAAAENAAKAGEVPIGCVIVRDGEVIATAGNRTLTDRDPTAHAELLAIRQAAGAARQRAAGRLRPLRHAGAVHDVRRRRSRSRGSGGCISARSIRKAARWSPACGSSRQPTCHHAPEIYSAVGEREAATLLREFFKARR